jgi:hypothetical protein
MVISDFGRTQSNVLKKSISSLFLGIHTVNLWIPLHSLVVFMCFKSDPLTLNSLTSNYWMLRRCRIGHVNITRYHLSLLKRPIACVSFVTGLINLSFHLLRMVLNFLLPTSRYVTAAVLPGSYYSVRTKVATLWVGVDCSKYQVVRTPKARPAFGCARPQLNTAVKQPLLTRLPKAITEYASSK